jgi:hypothetical protein
MISTTSRHRASEQLLRPWWSTSPGTTWRPCLYLTRNFDPSWLAIFNEEGVRSVILDRYEDRGLLRLLRHSRDWVIDFMDHESVIFVRFQ